MSFFEKNVFKNVQKRAPFLNHPNVEGDPSKRQEGVRMVSLCFATTACAACSAQQCIAYRRHLAVPK